MKPSADSAVADFIAGTCNERSCFDFPNLPLSFPLTPGRHPAQEFQLRAAQAAVDLAPCVHLILARSTLCSRRSRRQAWGAASRAPSSITCTSSPAGLATRPLAAHYDKVAQALAELGQRFGIRIVVGAQTNRDDAGIRQGDGLLNAGDMVLRVRKVDLIGAPDQAWLEIGPSQYTPREDVGSEESPAFEIDTAGPAFRKP